MDPAANNRLIEKTAQIVAAHAAAHTLSREDLLVSIRRVYQALANQADVTSTSSGTDREPLVPAVPPERSVFPDHIICLEDGKRYRMLKRHLIVSYKMTPQQYRQRWGLPPDYPMVAPDLKHKRAVSARQIRRPGRRRGPSGETASLFRGW